jgi:hypothetical protein
MFFKKEVNIKIVDKQQFESLNNKIDKENNLVRCVKCGHLLSKSLEDMKTIQHRGIRAIVSGKVTLCCPECKTIISF